jgi:hypothetical protein
LSTLGTFTKDTFPFMPSGPHDWPGSRSPITILSADVRDLVEQIVAAQIGRIDCRLRRGQKTQVIISARLAACSGSGGAPAAGAGPSTLSGRDQSPAAAPRRRRNGANRWVRSDSARANSIRSMSCRSSRDRNRSSRNCCRSSNSSRGPCAEKDSIGLNPIRESYSIGRYANDRVEECSKGAGGRHLPISGS